MIATYPCFEFASRFRLAPEKARPLCASQCAAARQPRNPSPNEPPSCRGVREAMAEISDARGNDKIASR